MKWGSITAAAYALCAAKYATKRMDEPELDRAFLKIHVVAACVLPVAAGIHTFKMLGAKPSAMRALTGAAANAGIAGLMYSHFFSKTLKAKSMPLHRASTVVTGAAIAAHCVTRR